MTYATESDIEAIDSPKLWWSMDASDDDRAVIFLKVGDNCNLLFEPFAAPLGDALGKVAELATLREKLRVAEDILERLLLWLDANHADGGIADGLIGKEIREVLNQKGGE